jgi:hypothetical protein
MRIEIPDGRCRVLVEGEAADASCPWYCDETMDSIEFCWRSDGFWPKKGIRPSACPIEGPIVIEYKEREP